MKVLNEKLNEKPIKKKIIPFFFCCCCLFLQQLKNKKGKKLQLVRIDYTYIGIG